MPDLAPGDVVEAALLRVTDEIWGKFRRAGRSLQDANGAIQTGDPVVDAWEREALAQAEAEDDEEDGDDER